VRRSLSRAYLTCFHANTWYHGSLKLMFINIIYHAQATPFGVTYARSRPLAPPRGIPIPGECRLLRLVSGSACRAGQGAGETFAAKISTSPKMNLDRSRETGNAPGPGASPTASL
jgi:hypothetical protein